MDSIGGFTAARRSAIARRLLVSMLVLAGIATAASAQTQTYGVGTSPLGTITYSAGAAIATVATQKTGLQLRVQPYSGTTAAMPLVDSGELDFVLCNALEAEEALNGVDVFQGHKNPNIRVVAVIFPLHSTIFVRKDSDIHSIQDLKGHTMPIGYTSQGIIRILQDGVLATAGLTTGDVKGDPVPNIVRGADDFAAGKADAFFFAVGAAKVAEVDASVGGIRAVPVANTPEALAAMRRFTKPVYIAVVKPGRNTAGVAVPTAIQTYDYLLVAGAKASDDAVYKVAKALHDDKEGLAGSFGGFHDFDPDHMAKPLPVAYHPGAIKYYKEIGQWPPKD